MNLLSLIFLFINIYQPISHYVPFAFNLLLFGAVTLGGGRKYKVGIKHYYILPIVVLCLSLFSFMTTRDQYVDYPALGSSLITLCNIIMFPRILFYFYKRNVKLFNQLSLVLLLHCLTVLIQLVYPGMESVLGPIFGFSREDYVIGESALRKLGLTGGYDQSGLYVTIAVLFSLSLYLYSTQRKYLLYFVVAFIASLFTSRTGMAGSCIAIVALFLTNKSNKKNHHKFKWFIMFAAICATIFYYVAPFILNSMGFATRITSDVSDVFSSRTLEYLFVYHLLPLDYLNVKELLLGYGCRVSQVRALTSGSDIGYIKQIFEVGIVGVVLCLIFCHKWVSHFRSIYSLDKRSTTLRFSYILVLFLFILYVFFHYKNYFIWSGALFSPFLITVLSLSMYIKENPDGNISCM